MKIDVMSIDIISYEAEQFSLLSAEQIMEVKSAQAKKDRLEQKLEEDIQKEKDALVKKGIFNSNLFALTKAKLEEACEREITLIREGLLFYLLYTNIGAGEPIPPYEVNYAHSYEERLEVVKTYYEETYQSDAERFDAFKRDTFAARYLGELYAPLYDYFMEGLSI